MDQSKRSVEYAALRVRSGRSRAETVAVTLMSHSRAGDLRSTATRPGALAEHRNGTRSRGKKGARDFRPPIRAKALLCVLVLLGVVSHIDAFHHKQDLLRNIRGVIADTLKIPRDEKQIQGNA